jgi:hypothetical protein
MLILLFWIVLAAVVGGWASNKGRNGVGFFLVGALPF